MKIFGFKGLLQNDGWLRPAYIRCDHDGVIENISDVRPQEGSIEFIEGFALPSFQNGHSHAFQYAMTGLAENNTSAGALKGNFWSWREAMYQIALSIQPDQLEAIASMLYAEMIRHGYSHVAEFHYLHHAPDGKPYQNLAELAERLVSAAATAGINITIIPIFYQKGGFGKEPTDRQRRFISRDRFAYYELLEAAAVLCKQHSHASIASGIHSLRAVDPEEIRATLRDAKANMPIHIHVAEQELEVEKSLAFLGKRPVEWITDTIGLNENFHLVHATHLNQREIESIARAGAHVVLCPSTEGNLGDGLFAFEEFQKHGGRWSIGTDSHIGLNPFEELRWLDYGQRLKHHNRSTFYSSSNQSGGLTAIEQTVISGRRAMGNHVKSFFRKGSPLNALVMDANNPLLASSGFDHLTNTITYASDITFNLGTIINGKWIVKKNRHHAYEKIEKDFVKAVKSLRLSNKKTTSN